MTSLPLKLTAAAAFAMAATVLPAAGVMAADEKAKQEAPKASFSDKRLNDFAAAAKEVFAIRQKYAPQFKAADNDIAKKQIVQSARGEMEQAIKSKGLTLEQYNEVLVAARDDQMLADKLGKMMETMNTPKG
jgi:hypothetical protein